MRRMIRRAALFLLATAAMIGLFIAAPSQPVVANPSPFDTLLGSWRGSGTVQLDSGKERLSCNAYYTGGGNSLGMAIRCTSDSSKVEIRSKLSLSGNRITGNWEERTYNASGSASGTASSGRISHQRLWLHHRQHGRELQPYQPKRVDLDLWKPAATRVDQPDSISLTRSSFAVTLGPGLLPDLGTARGAARACAFGPLGAIAMGEALLTHKLEGERLELAGGGSWTATHAGELEALIDRVAGEAPEAKDVSIDMAGVREFDTFGAWLLERLTRQWAASGREAVVLGLPEHDLGLLKEMHGVNREAPAKPKRENPIVSALAAFGRGGADFGRNLIVFAEMLGAVGMALGRVLIRPREYRLTSTVHQFDRVAWQAVPIIVLITFLIGGIISQQGIFHFRKFGAELYSVDLVAILVLREIGVLIVAIMVAGRSGSSYTAEIGSMKMREEIDALRTMGFDPVEVLILPRILVLIVALPVLTFLGSMAALYGGGLVAWLYGGMSPDIYMARLTDAISLTHFKVGMIKAPFMGLVIGIVACAEGLRVKGSAESLGIQTTNSVVESIFLVIVLDGLFAIFFASIGM